MFVTLLKVFGAILLSVIALVGCQTVRHSGSKPLVDQAAGTLRVATYNVHYIILSKDTGPWSRGDWERRKGPMALAFDDIDADVIGFQEMESFARGSGGQTNLKLDWLLQNNPEFAAAAVGDPSVFPSTQPILYRTARLALLDHGWFFFSETPDVIYSSTFNGSYSAFTSWAAFRDLDSGAEFKVVNIHTDFGSLSNRVQSVELVAARIAPWIEAGETVFAIGDLNARIGDKVANILADTGLDFAPVQGATFHFNRGINLFGAIDHIAATPDATLTAGPFVLRQKYGGEWPTDHYPVVADYRLNGAP